MQFNGRFHHEFVEHVTTCQHNIMFMQCIRELMLHQEHDFYVRNILPTE